MKSKLWRLFALMCAVLCPLLSVRAAEMRTLPGHVPDVVARLQPLDRVPAANRLHLAISLPLRNRDALTNFLQRLYDPASPDYRHYLTPEQFTREFGPTEEDYQKVIHFARTNGLNVATTHRSRMVLDLQGQVSDVEKTFHVTLHNYQHPTEPRQFHAPDVEPSVDSSLPILDIHGLSDYAKLRPMSHKKTEKANAVPASGSAPGGNYMGKDFTDAYLPGVSLNGAGQMVGLLEFDGYYTNDIAAYETLAGLPSVPLINVPIDGFSGPPGAGVAEVSLDIELAVSMAPGLSAVVVFEAPNDVSDWIDLLDSMASSNQISQFSSSWGYTGGTDPNTDFDTEFQKMAAQGQSFFQASGDGDAWVNPIWVPADSPYVTSVGGTLLTMNGSGASYGSEMVWNSGDLGAGDAWSANGNGYWGSGGGVSTVYPIPMWQQGVSMTANSGSTNMRNIPDVALAADDIWVIYNNGESESFMGTSCAAPLWAGFIALANQQAAANGDTNVGFINPALYEEIGPGSNYTSCFHDITTGNNTNALSLGLYQAVSGYDLCTGWGTPLGSNLINALAPLNAFQIFPSHGFTADGGKGGPFKVSCQTYVLTNTGTNALAWQLANPAPWLSASPGSGTLTPGGPAAVVTVTLNTTASNEVVGTYSAAVWFTNLTDGIAQERLFTLNVLAPPSITMPPTNQTVLTGTPALFTAAATGGLPLCYQWRHDGTNLTDDANISGSTTTALTLASVSMGWAGSYTIVVSNAAGAVTSTPPAILTVFPSPQLVQNGGFETGSFSSWTMSGNAGGNLFVSTGGAYAHSGQYGVKAGPSGSLGYLSQTLPTVPGQLYWVSLWFDSANNGATPNEFSVAWNGSNLFDQANLPGFGWTNLQFTVLAAITNTVLQFGFQNDPAYFGLDEVSVLPLRPVLQNAAQVGGTFTFSWGALQGSQYQIQSVTNLTQTNWTSLGSPVTATNFIMTASHAVGTNQQQYYRVVLLP